ncbi:ABC transporter substrate-binding protein, partial [Rhizobium ruizarguesonis]
MAHAKEFLVTSNGANPKEAEAFLDYWTSAEAANLIAKNGYASPSSQVDSALYGEAKKTATAAVASSKLQF